MRQLVNNAHEYTDELLCLTQTETIDNMALLEWRLT